MHALAPNRQRRRVGSSGLLMQLASTRVPGPTRGVTIHSVPWGEARLGSSDHIIILPDLLATLALVVHLQSAHSPSIYTHTFTHTYTHTLPLAMSTHPRYYYSLPTEAPQRSRSGSRRPPLTPSTVSSPCLTTLVPTTSRRDSATSGSPIKASILLAKVASSPTTPRGETPPGSPMLSPRSRLNSEPSYPSDRPAMSRTESDRYVRQYRQQGKHIEPMPLFAAPRH